MDSLLSPISTTYKSSASNRGAPLLQEVERSVSLSQSTAAAAPARKLFTASSAEEALEILRNEPDYETLVSVLRFLLSDKAPVDVRQPTPVSAQLVQVLVTEIVPNYWPVLYDEHEAATETAQGPGLAPKGGKDSGRPELDLLLACLRSVTGLSALLVRLRALLAKAKTAGGSTTEEGQTGNPAWHLRVLLELLPELLAGDEAVLQIWAVSTAGGGDDAKRRPLAHEFLSIIGGGRVVSLAAEAEAIVKDAFRPDTLPPAWIASGKEYSLWLARNIIRWSRHDTPSEDSKARGGLLGKALQLGYPDAVISTFVSDLVVGSAGAADNAPVRLLEQLPAYEQKKILSGVLKFAADTYFGPIAGDATTADAATVSAVAGLVKRVVGASTPLEEQLVLWLCTNAGVELTNGIGVRRAAMAVVSGNRKALSDILEHTMSEFGDQLFVKHAPIMQQEAKAQVLLLSAGYVSRQNPRGLASLLRSRTYLALVSNRLGASHDRAKILGMAVGEALSSLVDDSKQKLDFHMDETNTEEVKWYKGLVGVSDTVGSPDLLQKQTPGTGESASSKRQTVQSPSKAPTASKPAKPKEDKGQRQPAQPRTAGFIIEELDDSADEGRGREDDGLAVYAKPDSDAEDSDDDPTLVQRDKPKAPVYVRDLIAYFHDTENYDKQRLALTTAPLLIRRKATFGTEVQQHAHDLASILAGLQDKFDMEDFDQLRLQGMVALAVAQPRLIGPTYAVAFFEGDYSLAQRATLLTALGLGARELAGFDASDYAAAAAFPTKQLPERMERLYLQSASTQPGGQPGGASSLKALTPGALDSITDSLTAGFLRPIAATAADEAAGPDVLKLSSFKSRALQQKNAKGPGSATRSKGKAATATVNTAGQLLASCFFFPLVARFQLVLQASSSARMRSVLFEPSLLALYIKALAVVLHAAGPSALALPDMTAELWRLLLSSSVQAHCVGDLLVTHAVFFALMALLDVNENRARELCRDLPREVVQTRDWALQVLEAMRVAGADAAAAGSQEAEVQMLAAGAYIRLTEGMESYKSLLLGEMIG